MRPLCVQRVIVIVVLGAICAAAAQDPASRRQIVRNGVLYRGTSAATVRAIETQGLFTPRATEEDVIKTFIRVSDVGGTGVWFDLEGLGEDGMSIDPAHVEALRKVKAECIYRYIAPVCRLFGGSAKTDREFRMNAVRTVAKTFADDFAMIYWIDGPNSDALVEEFKKLAPKLTVLSPRGGDLALIYPQDKPSDRQPSFVVGAIPGPWNSPLHCLMPGDETAYAAFEEAAADPIERLPFTPTTIGLSEAEKADGFVSLFNGTSLEGWTITGRNKAGFVLKDGAIEWAAPGGGTVRSRDRYDNFVLRLEWKILEEGGNSGIFLRAPRANRQSKMGFEFQIMGDYGAPPGVQSTGAIYSVLAPLKNAGRPAGQWNDLEIRLDGPHYRAVLNGEVIQDVNFDDHPELRHRLRRGFIAIQDHSNPAAFRNIRIKKL